MRNLFFFNVSVEFYLFKGSWVPKMHFYFKKNRTRLNLQRKRHKKSISQKLPQPAECNRFISDFSLLVMSTRLSIGSLSSCSSSTAIDVFSGTATGWLAGWLVRLPVGRTDHSPVPSGT